MNRLKVYLDTSVISALFDDRTPERMAMTKSAWSKLDEFDVFVSNLVIEELSAASLKDTLLDCIENFERLSVTDEVAQLAQAYVDQEIFPDAYFDDALHVALASVYSISYLLSWNFKHLVKVKTRKLVALTNALKEYPAVEIIAPPEL